MGLSRLRPSCRPGPGQPPALATAGPYKSHLAYVRDRRSDADADAILTEALTKLRTSA